ncbi:hypothetical protein TYRP_013644, partial [Tyrophagus putrescentiae]
MTLGSLLIDRWPDDQRPRALTTVPDDDDDDAVLEEESSGHQTAGDVALLTQSSKPLHHLFCCASNSRGLPKSIDPHLLGFIFCFPS